MGPLTRTRPSEHTPERSVGSTTGELQEAIVSEDRLALGGSTAAAGSTVAEASTEAAEATAVGATDSSHEVI